ncbi:MAG: hypothetical protein AAFR01_12150 [Pseudomonadota bacterium]
MSDHDRACLDRAWTILHRLISLLQVRLPALCLNTKDLWRLLHLTRVAESMVRRWLVLQACVQGQWPTPRHHAKSSTPVRSHGSQSAKLAIIERDPRSPVFIYQPEQDGEPGYYLLAHAPGSGLPATDARLRALNLQTLKRRIDALGAVIAAPAIHVRRFARWLARAATRRKTRPCKPHPFRVGWPPGASRRQRRLDPERQNMLLYLDQLARDAVMRAAPS